MTDEQQPAPKIEFPCENYPIKVMGDNVPNFREQVTQIMLKHAPDLDIQQISENLSRNQRFKSIRFLITATGVEQLQALFDELRTLPQVKMVL
ncbi:YbeD family protein [Balneatrix alpica]|uniref:UPF0250 protein ACFFLH_12090 n=1 Tax=Balneatrix alpica TaxID=75684 RepID=A0ABV5ZCZ1_9GAMM|nr:DUF493 family protein [Balneatrix alpica]